MPSKSRYEREKARAAEKGTTPYRERLARSGGVDRYGRERPAEVLTGHGPRFRARRWGKPTGFCVVCGSQIVPWGETRRAKVSYACRPCDSEAKRRYRAGGPPSFQGLAALEADQVWVARRQAQSKAAGIEVRAPKGVVA